MADDERKSLLEHITELRARLLRVVLALIIGMAPGLLLAERAIQFLVTPLGENRPIVLGPTDAPLIYFKVALFLGLILVLPYILFQIYGFLAPGLYPNEKRLLLLGIPAVLLLFFLGALFTLEVLIPTSIPVLTGFLQDIVQPLFSLEAYLSFATTLIVWMGVLFQTPLVIYGLVRAGLVTPDKLKSARKVVIFLSALAAAIITPTTDPVTMLLVTGPFIVLYEIGVLLAGIAARQRGRALANVDPS